MQPFLQYYEGVKVNMANLVMKDESEIIGSSFCIVDNGNDIYDRMVRLIKNKVESDPTEATDEIFNVMRVLEDRKAYLDHVVQMNLEKMKKNGMKNPRMVIVNMLSAIATAESSNNAFRYVQVLKSGFTAYTNDTEYNMEVSDLILILSEEKDQWVDFLVQ